MNKRLVFQCWYCKRNYSLYKEITSQQTLVVPCPYCNQKAVVKLEPFRVEIKTVMRGDSGPEETAGYTYHFPDVIPTQKPE